jgi:hypothetical protein
MELCRTHFITGFPSIRVFRRGHDDIVIQGTQQHESYMGDRTKADLEKFADSLVPSAGLPHEHRSPHGQLVVRTWTVLGRILRAGSVTLSHHASKRQPRTHPPNTDPPPPHDSSTPQAAPTVHGCNLAGFVLVKKVPGTLHFTARADGHSFDHAMMNMTHMVHQFYFGARPSPRKL